MIWFAAFVFAIGLERLAELRLTRRNLVWSRDRGGVESGFGHFPFMVALHTGLLVAAPLEVALGNRPFIPALGWPMLVLVLGAQALRWWCIHTLGYQWNTRIVVVPGLRPRTGGPYRYVRHPNYVAVVLEGVALPLVHTAWLSAAVFTALNAALLTVRIRAENRALLALA